MTNATTGSAEMEKLLSYLYNHTRLYGAVMKHRTIMEKGSEWHEKVLSYIHSLQKHCQELEEKKDKYKRTLEYLLHQSGEKDGNIGEYEMKLIEKCLGLVDSPKSE